MKGILAKASHPSRAQQIVLGIASSWPGHEFSDVDIRQARTRAGRRMVCVSVREEPRCRRLTKKHEPRPSSSSGLIFSFGLGWASRVDGHVL